MAAAQPEWIQEPEPGSGPLGDFSQTPYVTSEEYLQRERQATTKSEYWEGEIVAMAGGSPEHSAIAANITIALGVQLRGKPCRPFNSDLRVRTTPQGLYAYPDLTIVCGDLEFHDGVGDVITNPTVIVEVLSPATESADRGYKWLRYRQIPSLTEYLLVAQDRALVEHYARLPGVGDRWLLTTFEGMDAVLRLASIGCDLPLAEVYAGLMLADGTRESQ